MDTGKVRIDKWLWAVRVFKTRKVSGDSCSRGHVRVNGQKVKPSRTVSAGDTVVVRKEGLERVLLVKACLDKRVGAKKVSMYMVDQTPPEDLERYIQIKRSNRPVSKREKGAGRPTKKERRIMDRLRGRNG